MNYPVIWVPAMFCQKGGGTKMVCSIESDISSFLFEGEYDMVSAEWTNIKVAQQRRYLYDENNDFMV